MDGAGKALRTVVAPGTTVGKTLRAGKDAARVFRDGVRVRTPAPGPGREGPGTPHHTPWPGLNAPLEIADPEVAEYVAKEVQRQQQALEIVLGRLKETSSNVEFLMQVQKSMPQPTNGHGTAHSHGHENDHR